jgi:hypothetical protein
MHKKVLVLYYSQTGQLGDILKSLVSPIVAAGHMVEFKNVQPANAYQFPWTSKRFFDVMPDCVLEVPTVLQPIQLKETAYDLVLFGYQAWFLSPSIPSNAILQDEAIRAILKNTPVITVTGARNMWISALESIKKTFTNIGTKHVGNIVTIDRHVNLLSFFSIQYWMYTGKKESYKGILPKPGVSDEDIANCSIFGETIVPYLNGGNFEGMQQKLIDQKAVVVSYNLMTIESKAKRIFNAWANLIAKRKNKAAWLVAFKYYLIIAFFVVGPIILLIDTILLKPFSAKRIKKQFDYYSGVNQQN